MPREGPTAGITSVVESVSGIGISGSQHALVVGGGHVGRTVASHLSDDYDVTFVSRNRQVVERTTRGGVTTHHVEEIDANALAEANAVEASLAVAASADDGINFLASQLLRTTFGVENVVIRVDDRENLDSFDDLDVETVCVPELLVAEMSTRLESVADDVAEI
ncbi:NAD-binding protein [Halorussus salinisoli]|uniref:NAD-binding protein n=1 Tax=Halorussus salinisoli TaxID=2558242 RepID=UPI0010C1A60A|nr:TrkA family potassium uptake protein [Halorussus salinisoli]